MAQRLFNLRAVIPCAAACVPCLLPVLLISPHTAFAATIPVTTCSAADLIAAIDTANGNPDSDTITLKAGCTYQLQSVNNSSADLGPNGLPVIASDITIVGNGATIARSSAPGIPAFRILQIQGGPLALQELTLSGGNAAGSGEVLTGGQGAGGAILNNGHLTLTATTLSQNHADYGGGALYNSIAGDATVNNSTISGNTAGDGGGGGINNFGLVTLEGSTLGANSAGFAGGISNDNGVNIWNTLIAGNSAPSSPDCVGLLDSQGHNLIQDSQYCTLVNNTTGDITDVDARLGPLQDNGGPTFTHALLSGSPAIDAGNPDAPGSSQFACFANDQRGIARPQDGNGDGVAVCDIGAYELAPAPLTVAIDVEPYRRANVINLQGRMVPVAILTTDNFDAANVDPESVCFGSANDPSQRACMPLHCKGELKDVDGDGDLDLLLYYETSSTGIVAGDRQACLTGKTYDGQLISGCDRVRTRN
jgi:hypothetical protein